MNTDRHDVQYLSPQGCCAPACGSPTKGEGGFFKVVVFLYRCLTHSDGVARQRDNKILECSRSEVGGFDWPNPCQWTWVSSCVMLIGRRPSNFLFYALRQVFLGFHKLLVDTFPNFCDVHNWWCIFSQISGDIQDSSSLISFDLFT